MKIFLLICFILIIPLQAFAFGSVNPAAINQYKYYQSTPCWNRNSRVQKPCIYSEQQARYYGYRVPTNNAYNQSNRQTYGGYSYGYGYVNK